MVYRLGLTVMIGSLFFLGMCVSSKGQAQVESDSGIKQVVARYAAKEEFPPLRQAMKELGAKLESGEFKYIEVSGPTPSYSGLIGQIVIRSGLVFLQISVTEVKLIAEHHGLGSRDYSDRIALDMAVLLRFYDTKRAMAASDVPEQVKEVAALILAKEIVVKFIALPLAKIGRNPLRIPLPKKRRNGIEVTLLGSPPFFVRFLLV